MTFGKRAFASLLLATALIPTGGLMASEALQCFSGDSLQAQCCYKDGACPIEERIDSDEIIIGKETEEQKRKIKFLRDCMRLQPGLDSTAVIESYKVCNELVDQIP